MKKKLADGRVGVHHPGQDVAPRRVGERTEQLVEVVRRRMTYNHLVVDSSTRGVKTSAQRKRWTSLCARR